MQRLYNYFMHKIIISFDIVVRSHCSLEGGLSSNDIASRSCNISLMSDSWNKPCRSVNWIIIIILGLDCSIILIMIHCGFEFMWMTGSTKFMKIENTRIQMIPQMSVYMYFLELDSEWDDVPSKLPPSQNSFHKNIFSQ